MGSANVSINVEVDIGREEKVGDAGNESPREVHKLKVSYA
jgi:hypothetical protein